MRGRQGAEIPVCIRSDISIITNPGNLESTPVFGERNRIVKSEAAIGRYEAYAVLVDYHVVSLRGSATPATCRNRSSNFVAGKKNSAGDD